ncbi:DUF4871 domain-containing protein [Guptibacillus hwajinpoensis]|uniref:DUF4871 domain-containing protein n=1 Tax=Guptibacillus hwajinpoensis TaxID=208199 RepID=A0ABU0JZX9_9BACL|nr:DUF4871 domain-containing protein [Alkalihalobacillus hemicentroti]MDQ0481796.1 hypothetical protein [Alkalihalobacillus hemicentroti]
MKFAKYIILSLMLSLLFGCNDSNEAEESSNNSLPVDSSMADEKGPPVDVDRKLIQNIDWEVSETFNSGSFVMRGLPEKVAFIDEPFKENIGNKYMWHFWGDIPDGKLTVLAIKEGSNEIVPALIVSSYEDERYVWTSISPAGPNNGADAHLPSNMKLNEKGKWALLVYLGENHVDNIVVEVN